jgi:predicted metal-dependent peptidase
MSSNQKANEELSHCVNQLLIKEPFFAHMLSGLVRVFTNRIPTIAVGFKDNQIALFVNADFYTKELKGIKQKVAVLKHEVLHLVFRHLFRQSDFADLKLLNLAADIVINQFISSNDLPDGAITLQIFNSVNLRENETLEYYYAELQKIKDGKYEQLTDSDVSPKALLDAVYGRENLGNHSLWCKNTIGESLQEYMPGRDSAAEKQLAKKIMDSLGKLPNRGRGYLPGEVVEEIEMLEKRLKSKLDWKKALRLFASGTRSTKVYRTIKRESKRFGTRPGVKIKREPGWKLAVVIDTSGSVHNRELEAFMHEIRNIHNRGAEILIIQADARVQTAQKFTKNYSFQAEGRGGTDFNPALEFINESKTKYAGVIYFTDGGASAPEVKCKYKILYVIVGSDSGQHLLESGKVIKLNWD